MAEHRFDNIIGQRDAVRFLQNAVRTGRVPHALILCGGRGIGKMDLAMAFAAALQCEEHGEESCGHCRSCKQISADTHPDVIVVTNARAGAETKTSVIGVKAARFVQADVSIKPYEGPWKIYIIPDAHNMNPQAQNALLKTLEEPPAYAVLILLAQTTAAFLPTVLSRCITLNLRPVSEEDLVTALVNEQNNVSPDGGFRFAGTAADTGGDHEETSPPAAGDAAGTMSRDRAVLCARLSHGNPGRCRQLAQDEELWDFRSGFIAFMERLPDVNSYDIVQYAEQVTSKEGSRMDDFLDFGLSWFRDILSLKSCCGSGGAAAWGAAGERLPETDAAAGTVRDADPGAAGDDPAPCTLIFADEITYINKVKDRLTYPAIEAVFRAFDDAARRRAAKGNDTQILEVLLLSIRRAMSRR